MRAALQAIVAKPTWPAPDVVYDIECVAGKVTPGTNGVCGDCWLVGLAAPMETFKTL